MRNSQQTAGFEVIAQVLRLQAVIGKRAEEGSLERVSAVARDDIRAQAAIRALRPVPHFEAEFLHGRIVRHDGVLEPAESLAVVVEDAIVQQLLLVGPTP